MTQPHSPTPSDAQPSHPVASSPVEVAELVVEDGHFAVVPEWVIDLPIPDAAFRIYSVLLRYGQTSGSRMPSRATIARRTSRSVDSVDRAMRHLQDAGLVRVEHRRNGQRNLTNRYWVRTSAPARPSTTSTGPTRPTGPPAAAGDAPAHSSLSVGGRTAAATPRAPTDGDEQHQRAASTPASTSAPAPGCSGAEVRHDPESLTQRTPPSPPSPAAAWRAAQEEEALLRDMDIDPVGGLQRVADECARLRAVHDLGTACWQPPRLLAALHLAVQTRLWPARYATDALLRIAADPTTRSPMRLAEAGPWWDAAAAAAVAPVAGDDVNALEARLQALDSGRMALQAEARAELELERMPLTRTTVYQRACEILDRRAAS